MTTRPPAPRPQTGTQQAIRDRLLAPTIAFAALNVPYYQASFGPDWQQVRDVASLSLLPILRKQKAIEVQRELLSGVPTLPTPYLSSGTRRDGTQVLEVMRSQAEIDEEERLRQTLAQLHVASDGKDPKASEGTKPRRVLSLLNIHHGMPLEPGSPYLIRVPFAMHENSVIQVVRLLQRDFGDGEGITAMLASVNTLIALTLRMGELGLSPAQFAVRNIGTTSAYLSQPRRAFLEKSWDARLWDNYSLSEFSTPATECECCDFYHFRHPPIAFEVLHPIDETAISGSVGVLVLTGLYPFMQAMPLIRYWTDDVVEIEHQCPLGDAGIRWLGRRDECVFHEQEGQLQLLFAPAPLFDLLDANPLFARTPHLFERSGFLEGAALGEPSWKVDAEMKERACLAIRLEIGVGFRPALFADVAAQMQAQISAHLYVRFPALEALVASGECRLEVALVYS